VLVGEVVRAAVEVVGVAVMVAVMAAVMATVTAEVVRRWWTKPARPAPVAEGCHGIRESVGRNTVRERRSSGCMATTT